MDFLPKTVNLQGGDTRKHPQTRNLANHGIRQRARVPPTTTPPNPANHAKPSKSASRQGSPPRQPLKIHQITPNPLNPF